MAKEKNKKETKTCNYCGLNKELKEFYSSQSIMYKNDGKLPICKNCLIEVYENNLQYYKNVEKAVYKTLFSLDVYYDVSLVKKSVIDTFEIDGKHIITTYFSKINLIQYKGKTSRDSQPMNIWDMSDDDFDNFEIEDLVTEETILITREMLMRWGQGRSIEDYMFLEDRYNTMCNTYGNRNPNSVWTYIEMALNYLDIRKEREKDNPDQKKINDINASNSKLAGDCKMKEQQIDNSEDDNICFGNFIKEVEDKEPIIGDKLYEDVDQIHKVFIDDYRHPIAKSLDIDDSGKKLKRKKKKGDSDDNKD